MSDLSPIALLRQLEASVRSTAVGLPEQEEITEVWSGIGFRIGDFSFVAPMSEVTELLRVPAFTRLPNVKPWVLGVSNIRGRLIPLIDMNVFFGIDSAKPIRSKRILVIEPGDQSDGLIVDGVEGMQYFPQESYVSEAPELPASLIPFVDGHFVKENRIWTRFSMEALSNHDLFQDVAV